MILAAGIDLGGTKLEAQVFDASWAVAGRQRWPTPKTYPELLQAMCSAAAWCEQLADGARQTSLPIGVAAAGLMNPRTGLALAANLATSGHAIPEDLHCAAGRPITWINDCRALALSEARFGAAMGYDPALALIFGTGLSGGVVTHGQIMPAFAGLGGEFGHFPLPAGPMMSNGLPILPCGCGRMGCTETLLSAPGLTRIAAHVTGRDYAPEEIVAGKTANADLQKVWDIWLELACDFLITLCFTIDPAVIVLGGGLSNAPNLADDLTAGLQRATLRDFAIPPIKLAQGGDASGARGAAYAAWLKVQP